MSKDYRCATCGEWLSSHECPNKIKQQAEQIAAFEQGILEKEVVQKQADKIVNLKAENQRLKELTMHTHDTLLSVRGNCECDNAKIFKIRQEHKQALAAQPQGGAG